MTRSIESKRERRLDVAERAQLVLALVPIKRPNNHAHFGRSQSIVMISGLSCDILSIDYLQAFDGSVKLSSPSLCMDRQ